MLQHFPFPHDNISDWENIIAADLLYLNSKYQAMSIFQFSKHKY